MKVPVPETIMAEHMDQAKERLILARATHLDSLLARLHEPRVRRILEPLIAGDPLAGEQTFDDDLAYSRDLGLVAPELPVRITNPIYREVVVRVLGSPAEANVLAEPRSFVLPDGRLDFQRLLNEFTGFWRANAEILTARDAYHEAAPQLVIMAFFHRLVNGGGFIDREYGIGRGRIDLLIRWPYQDEHGRREAQREAVELKVWRPGRADPLGEGLDQLDDYLARLGLDEGTLVIFDRRPDAALMDERIRLEATRTATGRAVTLLRA
jgi:hypothetical protein